jgi:flagellar basal-body rod protein FlgG
MSQALHNAASGIRAMQQRIDTIADNLANLSTTGFKARRQDFADALSSAMQNPAQPGGVSPVNLQLGHGVRTSPEVVDPGCGPLETTGNPLDLALEGAGFFMVETADGKVTYTRDGALRQTTQDGRNYLVTAGGQYVLDQNQARIASTQSLDTARIDPSGQIQMPDGTSFRLGVVQFADPGSLIRLGQNLYQPGAASGEPVAATATVRQGALEGSNVSLAGEMTRLMQTQRAYSLLSRALTTADEMRANENDIRR